MGISRQGQDIDDGWEEVKGERPPPRNSWTVQITASHIERGVRGDIFNDAPALAVREQISQVKWAMVGWGYANTGDRDGRKRYWDVQEWAAFVAWMRAYDYGKDPPPAEFTFVLSGSQEQKPVDPRRKPRAYKSFTQLESERRLREARRTI